MRKLREWLLTTTRKAEFDEERQLLNQFLTRLQATYAVKKEKIAPALQSEIEKRLFHSEKTDFSRDDANYVEQLLLEGSDEESLQIDMPRRLVSAHSELPAGLAAFYSEQQQSELGTDGKRMLLKSLVTDLQRQQIVRNAKMGYARLARTRISGAFIVLIVLFFAPKLVALVGLGLDQNWTLPPRYENMLIVLTAGLLGASTSLLIGVRGVVAEGALHDIKLSCNFNFIISRLVLGAMGSLFFFYVMQSQFIQSIVFPDFTKGDLSEMTLGSVAYNKNRGLLVVWSYIAGFSERLVPNILAKAEGHFDSDTT